MNGWVDGLDAFAHCQSLGNVPDVTAKSHYIILGTIFGNGIGVFFNGKLLPCQALAMFVELV
jgi:hypothetical protein